jgi:hypothetical protein
VTLIQRRARGYCAKIAWAADNPGYGDAGARAAAALKKVIEIVGDC